MKYFKCIACSFLFSFVGISCQPALAQLNLDSLKQVWKNEAFEDTTRLNALTELINHAKIISYIDSVGHYADIEIRDAKAAGSDKHLAHGLLAKGFYLISESQVPMGLDLFDSASTIYQRLGDRQGLAISNALKGNILMYTGQVDEGLKLCEEAYQLATEAGDLKGRTECASILAVVYNFKGDIAKRIHFARLAVKLSEELGDWTVIANAYHAMADVYLSLDIIDEGDHYHEQALEYCRKSGYISEEVNILGHLASIENKRGNYQKALQYLEQVLDWQDEHGTRLVVLASRAKKIHFLVNAKMYDQAKNEIGSFRLDPDVNALNSEFFTGLVDHSEGKMLADLGDPIKAAELCHSAYQAFLGLGQFTNELDACECLIESYKALGDHQKAIEFYERQQYIQEELNKEQVAKDLQKFEFKKQAIADSLAQVEKERSVQLAHQEEVRKKNKIKNWAIGAGLLFLLLAGGYYSRWRYVRKSRDIISKEKDRSDNLLLNILPAEIAEELKIKGKADARDFDKVSILFTDFKEFTQTSEKLSAQDLVSEINTCFEAFDGICGKYKVEKIKTIGDAYMAAGGLPVPAEGSVKNTVLAALEMQEFISDRKKEKDSQGEPAFEMRVGIHTGGVVAGIVGVKKFQYDIWGDTVNTASRIESNGEVGKVNISHATYKLIKDDPQLEFESRGKIEAKGKGEMEMYFVRLA